MGLNPNEILQKRLSRQTKTDRFLAGKLASMETTPMGGYGACVGIGHARAKRAVMGG
jgi:hypothetical protein